jgi:Flp pilus assembly protein TadG
MMRGLLARLVRDNRGATIVEFALITPALLITLMGLFDLAYNMYTAQQLQGAIQNAARQSTLEGASTNVSNIDAIVTRSVHAVAGNAVLTFDRTAYASFSSVARPEDYTDVNSDGTCNDGEPFEDANGNGVWDADSGSSGFGGARDAVLYTVTVVYPRAFPIAKLIPGQTDTFTLTATTVLRNQPYGLQNTASTATGNCT